MKKKINNENNLEKNIIKGILNITKDDVNEDIQIINSYENVWRKNQIFAEVNKDGWSNEKEIMDNIEIRINGKTIDFSYTYKFEKKGRYNIEYIFKKDTTNANSMFYDCFNLINLNLSNFNTQNATNMSYMFYNCETLTNSVLSKFNTQNVTNMSSMFYNCKSLTNINLSNFNTQNVTNMSNMFYNCKALINIKYQNPIVVQSIFQSKEFHEMDLNAYKNNKELSKLKDIQRDLVMGSFKFALSELDYEGNKILGWSINEKRGNKPYYPPLGWIGFGLKEKISVIIIHGLGIITFKENGVLLIMELAVANYLTMLKKLQE